MNKLSKPSGSFSLPLAPGEWEEFPLVSCKRREFPIVFITVTLFALGTFFLLPASAERDAFLYFIACGCIPFALIHIVYRQRWRLRVDSEGIALRKWICWRRWNWQDFTSGRVTLRETTNSFVDESRPFFFRTLKFAIDEPYQEIVHAHCRQFIKPLEVELPASLAIPLFPFGTRNAILNSEGLLIQTRRGEQFHRWEEVTEVQFMRGCRWHRSCASGKIVVGLRTYRFILPPAKRGDSHLATPFLEKFVPANRIVVLCGRSPAASVRECEIRLRQQRYLMYAKLAFLLPCLVLAALPGMSSVSFVPPILFCLLILTIMGIEDRRNVSSLIRRKAELAGNSAVC